MLTTVSFAPQAAFIGANAGAGKILAKTDIKSSTVDTARVFTIDSAKAADLVNFWKGKESILKTGMSAGCTAITAITVCMSSEAVNGKCPSGGSSGGGGGGGSSAPCFPSTARVTLEDGTQKQIDQLKEGEYILSATLDGGLAVDTVSLLSIADKTAKSKGFVSITTDGKHKLNATAGHHVSTGDKCCSQIKTLEQLEIGDTVWVRETGKPLPVAQKITDVEVVFADGLHSPVLTNGGLPIVNDFVTSFDTESKVNTAKAWLPSLLSLCKKTGTCGMAQKLFDYSDKEHIVAA